ncbi:MAG: N-6 DNA methylase [Planctomycetota bacterium]
MHDIAQQLNELAEARLSCVEDRLTEATKASWVKLHGWQEGDRKSALLLARQAALNAFLRVTFPDAGFFATPLDDIISHRDLPEQMGLPSEAGQAFNWWGELYNLLIPQAERRTIGQFWTGEAIADWMTGWLLQFNPRKMMDIGCGSGNFMLSAVRQLGRRREGPALCGVDISPLMLNLTIANFLSHGLPLPTLVERDYLRFPLLSDADAVICNPPYTRHHQVSPDTKDDLQEYLRVHLRLKSSRLGTMAFYFLLKAISEISEGCRAAVILPMQVLDARYGNAAKLALCRDAIIHAVIHFSHEMNAFENVDVGAAILLFEKGWKENNAVRHVTLREMPKTDGLLKLLESPRPQENDFGTLDFCEQQELGHLRKWFSMTMRKNKAEAWEDTGIVVPLKELASVMRGIATGANDFFALSSDDVKRNRLEEFVVKTIQRNREIQDVLLDEGHWKRLSDEGKRVWLLYLKNGDINGDPILQDYIAIGESMGFHKRSLVNTRRRWYLMEQREIPPIFFTILTRGSPRFILNRAGVRPLNMFSLIYPNEEIRKRDMVEVLWALLNSDFSISRLHSVSRTYGGNTLKVEPRELDNVPVVNPLLLPANMVHGLKCAVTDFFASRDTDAFRKAVNALVDDCLTVRPPSPPAPRKPKQLVLCERPSRYCKRRNR